MYDLDSCVLSEYLPYDVLNYALDAGMIILGDACGPASYYLWPEYLFLGSATGKQAEK